MQTIAKIHCDLFFLVFLLVNVLVVKIQAIENNTNVEEIRSNGVFERLEKRLRGESWTVQRLDELEISQNSFIPPNNTEIELSDRRQLIQKKGMVGQGGISCYRGYGKLGSAKDVIYEKKWLQYCGPKVEYCYAASINPFVEYPPGESYFPIMEDFYPEVDWEDNFRFYQAFYILDCGGAWRHDKLRSCPVKNSGAGEYEYQTSPEPPSTFKKTSKGITHIYAPATYTQRINAHGHPDIDELFSNNPQMRLKYGTSLIPNYCCAEDGCYYRAGEFGAAKGWSSAILYAPLIAAILHTSMAFHGRLSF